MTQEDEKFMKSLDESVRQDMPEAKSSVSYSLISKVGFPLIFTVRSSNEAELLELMGDLEVSLTKRGYTPEVKRSFGGANSHGFVTPSIEAKPSTITVGVCPDCGSPLIKITTKDGKEAMKCSTSKWDFATKTASGCKYFKYLDAPIDEPATPLQMQLLKDKNQWEEGLTKKAATARISSVIGK
jgi:hypothetical protein